MWNLDHYFGPDLNGGFRSFFGIGSDLWMQSCQQICNPKGLGGRSDIKADFLRGKVHFGNTELYRKAENWVLLNKEGSNKICVKVIMYLYLSHIRRYVFGLFRHLRISVNR